MTDSAKNILTSCRKKQWFLKFFDYGDFVKILLLRGQEICLRILKDGQKAQQKCLFNITSEVNEISKTSEGILLQTDEINYVIKNNMEAFSFKGKVTQVNKLFVTFGA